MPTERTAIRHVREVLRLRTPGISGNEIARRLNLAPSTVRLTLQRLATAGLSRPLSAELTDAALEVRLFTAVGPKQGHRNAVEIGRDVSPTPLPVGLAASFIAKRRRRNSSRT